METIGSIAGVLAVEKPSALGRSPTILQTQDEVGTDFSNVLENVKRENGSSEVGIRADANSRFEKMVLSQMLGDIFQEQAEGAFGEGMQGDFYTSLFTDAIAEQIIDKGGLGIAKIL